MSKNKGGRPTKMTVEILQKLESAFSIGATDRIACIHAGIVPATLYNYCKENPSFLERKELLKESPKFEALTTLNREIKKDGTLALKYLERKMKDEFGQKHEHDVNLSGTEHIKVTFED